jgi:hypothetical protein
MMETTADERTEAYDMGFNDSIELTTDEVREMTARPAGADDPAAAVSESFAAYTDGARWANSLLPRLRALAEFEDRSGFGTYTVASDRAEWRLDELVEAYRDGWVDKTLGYDRYASRSDLPADQSGAGETPEGSA